MGDRRSHSARLVAKRNARNNATAAEPSPAQSEADPPPDGSDIYVPDGHESDSDLASSAGNGKPAKGSKRTQDSPSVSDDSDGAENKKQPVKKKRKKAQEAVVLDPDRSVSPVFFACRPRELKFRLQGLVLMIPQASNTGTQREHLTHSTSFDDALAVIHETIGCAEVPKKPLLSYKLSNAAGKAPGINLGSAKDWDGCLEDVTSVEVKKKMQVSVTIIVTDQVSCCAFATVWNLMSNFNFSTWHRCVRNSV
jgi:hypothetical protein